MSMNDDLMEIQPMTPDYFEDSDEDNGNGGATQPAVETSTAPADQHIAQAIARTSQPHPAIIADQARIATATPGEMSAVLAASQQTRALFEQQQQKQRRQAAVALPAPPSAAEVEGSELRELEAQVRDAVQQGVPANELKILYAALLAKQRGVGVCVCRQSPRCEKCLSCAASHCQCLKEQTSATSSQPSTPHGLPQSPPPPSPVPSTPGQQQQVPATQTTPQPGQQQQQRRRPDISEVAHYYVTLTTGQIGLACEPCQNNGTATGLTCDACSRSAHFDCVTVWEYR